MAGTSRFDRAGGQDTFEEITEVFERYLDPAVEALREAVKAGDMDAVRAHAYELIVVAGSVVSALAPPQRSEPEWCDETPRVRRRTARVR